MAPEELAEQMRVRKAERETLTRRLAALDAPAERERLPAALEQRVADWRVRLRADHPDEARFVVKQLLGPITLWTEAPIPEELRGLVRATERASGTGHDSRACRRYFV